MTIYKKRIYKQISNIYATLPAFAADPPDNEPTAQHPSTNLHQNNVYTSTFRAKALRRVAARKAKANAKLEEELVLDKAITWAEDEHTALAKLDTALPRRTAIERGHTITKATTHLPSSKPARIGDMLSRALSRIGPELSPRIIHMFDLQNKHSYKNSKQTTYPSWRR